jgi:hypothetical protein
MRRFLSVTALLLLAPLVGEYLLGNLSVRMLPALPLLVPLYGCGALLVREVARRTGRGWPAMLALGAAYGVIEAGLVDQSMFNPQFEGHDFQAVTPIPALGLSASNTLAFVVGHAVWSIGVPIALVEHLGGPRRATEPWLGWKGLTVAALVYVAGCGLIYTEIRADEGFLASPGQRLGAAAAALLLIAVALRRPVPRKRDWWVPRPWLAGVLAFAATTVFFLRPETWAGFAFGVALLLVAGYLVSRTRWSGAHRGALAAGALLTYAWAGFALTALMEPGDPVRWYGNAALAAVAVALVVACALRRPAPVSPPPASAPTAPARG